MIDARERSHRSDPPLPSAGPGAGDVRDGNRFHNQTPACLKDVFTRTVAVWTYFFLGR